MTQKLWPLLIGVVGLVLFTDVGTTLAANWGAFTQGAAGGFQQGYQMQLQRQQIEIERQRMEMELEVQRQQMEIQRQQAERQKSMSEEKRQETEPVKQEDKPIRLDGYWWEKVSPGLKPVMVASYMAGYESGHIGGELSSAVKTVEVMKEEVDRIVKTDKKTVKYKETLTALQDSVVAKISANLDSYKALFGEAPDHYVAELESFYKTYPLCKGRHVRIMMFQLCAVWKAGSKLSYKEVGETCLV